ncbi:MAG: signal recognition particle-docking protein FtsY [Candidatus Lambdaproteobacteria bacterium]|nr:signal recognition particle-docking protein FtsY [Candidatus Lambdaproteobacteria bacterium]
MSSNKAERKHKKKQALRERAAQRNQGKGDAAAAPDPALERRLDKALRKAEQELAARDKAQREAEQQQRLARARERAEEAQARLRAEEEARRQREHLLARELPQEQEAVPPPRGLFRRLFSGLAKTRESLSGGLARLVLGKKEIDPGVLLGLEELLYTADTGPETAERLLNAVRQRVARRELTDPSLLRQALKEEVQRVMRREYAPLALERHRPAVVLLVGVNGSGKTTTIGKLAALHAAEGRRVLLAAGDTFRAAAGEQLMGWGRRVGCEVVSKPPGADPSAVIYEAVRRGLDEDYDLVLCDTAGRLHTKLNLMEELKKIKRVVAKLLPEAPHETLLVLDANTGQNAIVQTRDFLQAVGVTGLIVTKLDGTARGGVVVGIVNEFALPIRYVGVGEAVDDLRPFDAAAYAESLFA